MKVAPLGESWAGSFTEVLQPREAGGYSKGDLQFESALSFSLNVNWINISIGLRCILACVR